MVWLDTIPVSDSSKHHILCIPWFNLNMKTVGWTELNILGYFFVLSEFLIGIFYLSLNYYSRTENRQIFTHQGEVLCHLLLLILCYIYSHNSVYLFFLKYLICICSHFTKWFLSFVVGLRRPVDTTHDFHFYFSVLVFVFFTKVSTKITIRSM